MPTGDHVKLHHLRHFQAIAEQGSLHRAAQKLGIAQSALSRSLAELEGRLGVVLVERSRAGSMLTDAGQRFLVRASAIAEELRRAVEEAGQHDGQGRGRVSIGLSPASQMLLLPKVLPRFHRRWPDVALCIQDGMADAFETALIDGQLDFFIGGLPSRPLNPALRSVALRPIERVVLAHPESRWIHHRRLADLLEAPWAVVRATGEGAADQDAVFRANGLEPPEPFGVATSMLPIWLMMINVDALTVVPRSWISGQKSDHIFVQLPIEDPLGAVEIFAIRRAALPLTPAAQDMFDLVIELADFGTQS